ncbi:MAG: ABC transporter ATP-binding protein [bacterium]|nr:ABC transporter ATP-binding protein [bacterium]
MSAILKTERVSKWFGEVIAVNDCTLNAGPGVTGLLGLNGAGKTTLFKMLAGLINPSQGEILLFDRKLRRDSEVFRKVGFCPESDALFDWLTGYEFLVLMLRLMGFSGDELEQACLDALATVGLTDAADKRIGSYSKGMRQKIKMAQALAHNPDVILLDEPLNGMDPVSRRDIVKLIEQLGQQGKCVIVSSHILPEIETMTRNIILIHNGKLLAEGDVTEIREAIDDHPTVVAISSTDNRKLASILAAKELVAGVEVDQNDVIIRTDHAAAFYKDLPDWLVESGLEVKSIRTLDDSLQAVFEYLTGDHYGHQ